ELEGWLGLDDDQAQVAGGARQAIAIDARPAGSQGDWSTLLRMSVAHEPGRQPFVVESGELAGAPVELRIIAEAKGPRVARLGLNLELGATP
ncbi:MAG: hypothetical protein KC431_18680, partial [Myxococcales bacterium]|nr:hypothetical protein [Myxococcales bacterium]